MNLGSILRQRRKEQGATLKTIAEKAGISEGFLSQVENDVNSPSVDTLVNICIALGVDAGDVIKAAQKREKCVIIRSDEWGDADFPQSGFITRRFFPPENRRDIDSSVLVMKPGKGIPARKNVKNGQEVLCVLKGLVELRHGDARFTLHRGDAVHYWSIPEGQYIANTSKDLAVVMWVGTL
ncbi:MAG TPA: XRE family transcriptional regulator [Spirochaetes bacterium]|nr:XRE family transcriptional regulator [Spirochaetota bacterium]